MKTQIFTIILTLWLCLESPGQTSLSWRVVSRMLIPVTGATAVVKDSLIYILGGYSDSLRTTVDYIQEYNPVTNTWRLLPERMAARRRNFLSVQIGNDSVLSFGGLQNNNSLRRSIETWNFTDSTYIFHSNSAFNRSYTTGIQYKGKLIFFGGSSNSHHGDTLIHYLVEYDINQKKVIYQYDSTFYPGFPPAQQMCALVDSAVYIFGGVYFNISSSIYRYDIATRSFKRLTTKMPKGRASGRAVYIGDNKIMIIGGYSESQNSIAGTEIYTVNGLQTSMQQGPPMTIGRREFAVAVFKNSIYVFGGSSYNNYNISTVERLDLITDIEEVLEKQYSFRLYDNYPNPFNPSTKIRFSVATIDNKGQNINSATRVTLKVYNITGAEIATVVDADYLPGEYEVDFIPPSGLPGGVYFYSLAQAGMRVTKKMILIK